MNEETDLRSHYSFISRYFWISLAVSFAIYLLIGFRRGPFMQNLESEWTAVAQLALMLVLIAYPARRLHQLVLPLMVVLFCIGHLMKPLFE